MAALEASHAVAAPAQSLEIAAVDADRAAVLEARRLRKREQKAAARAAAATATAAGPTISIPQRLLDALDALPLTAPSREIAPRADVAKRFDALVGGRRKTWQASKRATHQLQIESLAQLLEGRGLLGPRARIVELGAGKGLLGAALRAAGLVALPPVALDRRACAGNYDGDGVRVVADLATCDLRDALAGVDGDPVLLGKHFCGAASDLAVKAAARSTLPLVLAPCCHPQITWETYAGRDWFAAHGLDEADFRVLLDLVLASKHARVEDAPRLAVDGELCWRAGLLARRAIEEGRAVFLRARGFAVEVVEYAPSSVTPDNLALVATPGPARAPRPAAGPRLVLDDGFPASGCALHVNRARGSDLPRRVAEYVLEGRRHAAAAAWVAHVRCPQRMSDVSEPLVVVCGDSCAATLATRLAGDARLAAAGVDMILPFDRRVETLDAVAAAGAEGPARVFGWPRSTERAAVVACADAGAAVATTGHASVLSVVSCDARGSPPTILYSRLPVAAWDPSAWRAAATAADRPDPRALFVGECAERLGADLSGAVVVADDAATAEAYAALVGGAATVATAARDGRWTFSKPAVTARVVLACLRVHGDALPCVDAWRAAREPASGARILARLRFGGRVPDRKMERLCAELSRAAALRYDDVLIAHLLGDKDHERTLSMVVR